MSGREEKSYFKKSFQNYLFKTTKKILKRRHHTFYEASNNSSKIISLFDFLDCEKTRKIFHVKCITISIRSE